MKSIFKNDLTDAELEKITRFCDSVSNCNIYQYPGWASLFYTSRHLYFYLEDQDEIKSYCIINIRLRSANVIYGPVCDDREILIESVREIAKYLKRNLYYFLGIRLFIKSGYNLEYIEYHLNMEFNIKYLFDREHTKSSIEIDLTNDIDDIWRRFREGHKKSIKKGIKSGITVDTVKEPSDLEAFADIYSRMCKVRKISDYPYLKQNINAINDFLVSHGKGEILISKDREGVIIGGDIFAYQGISVTMFLGCTDPERRDLPASHFLIFEAIKRAKERSFRYFDFGGYSHLIDREDQVFNINLFKKGFGGYYTFYAKTMNINLLPLGYSVYGAVNNLRKANNRLKMLA